MRKVLIAEDDPVGRKFVAKAIELMKLEPVLAEDGEKAWQALESNPKIDACVIDIMMPKLSGKELVERMRCDDRFMNMPVLLVSAYVGSQDISDLLSISVSTRFLPKPLNIVVLQDEVRILLGDVQPPPED